MDDSASKLKGLLWVVGGCGIGVLFGFGLSPLAHAIPWDWEKKISYALPNNLQISCSGTLQSQAVLQKLVTRIYPLTPEDNDFSIDVHIVRGQVVNAYAALGGEISVYSGLIQQAESPEELAGILAHEIGHVQHRHIMQGFITHTLTVQGINMIFTGGSSSTAEWAKYFLNMDFTRRQESQADEAGLMRLQKAHVDNQGFRKFFERMEKSGSASSFISDHPSNSDRIAMAEKFANKDITPILTPDEWNSLKHYCN